MFRLAQSIELLSQCHGQYFLPAHRRSGALQQLLGLVGKSGERMTMFWHAAYLAGLKKNVETYHSFELVFGVPMPNLLPS